MFSLKKYFRPRSSPSEMESVSAAESEFSLAHFIDPATKGTHLLCLTKLYSVNTPRA